MPLCLVVEDHSDTRDGYLEFLSFAGFTVMGATGRDEMLSRLADATPDAIVMDLQLPGTDGWTIIRELRKSPQTTQVPIVVVSASVRESDRLQAVQAGCDVFLPKPCDPSIIVAEIQRLIGRRIGREPSV
jgi:two-component system, cell cycle response regulator DivK